jgi:hypothetical protein
MRAARGPGVTGVCFSGRGGDAGACGSASLFSFLFEVESGVSVAIVLGGKVCGEVGRLSWLTVVDLVAGKRVRRGLQ